MTTEPYVPLIPLGEWNGGRINDWVTCVRADNPGHMTLDGTNTWIVRRPGSSVAVLIDPGPADHNHWTNVAAALGDLDVDPTTGVAGILITHHHADHTAGVDLFVEHTDAPVYAATNEHCRGKGVVNFDANGSTLSLNLADVIFELVPVPGHTRDSVAIVVPEAKIIFTGDTILGRGTTVVAYPDGNLAQYLDSLQRIRDLVVNQRIDIVLPGHGPTVLEPLNAIDFYLTHRQERLAQVADCLIQLGESPRTDEALARTVVETVYADVPEYLWPPASLSVLAQLEYLASAALESVGVDDHDRT